MDLEARTSQSAIAADPAAAYRAAISLAEEDARQRALKYFLMRLEIVGVTLDETEPLRQIAESVIIGADPTSAIEAYLKAPTTSPVGSALATIVLQEVPERRREALLGAILGAHAAAATSFGFKPDPGTIVASAVIGAATTTNFAMLTRMLFDRSWTEYASARD